MKIFKQNVIFLLVLTFFTSCSPVKRLERFEKRHPYLFKSVKVVDTFTFYDTVYIPKVKHDTTFTTITDTMYLTKEKLQVKIFYKDSTIYLEGECVGDTVYIYEDIIRELDKFQTKEPPREAFNWRLVLSIVPFVLLFLYIILDRKRKPP